MLAQCLALLVAFAVAQEPQGPTGERAREILSAPDYQTELPGVDEARFDEGRGEGRGRRRGRRPQGGADGGVPDHSSAFPRFSSDGIGFVFWILLGIAAVAGLVWLFSTARGYHRDVEVLEAHGPPQRVEPAAGFAAPALDRVEELARAGRFGEAIRLLLQLTFDALRGSGTGLATDASLTSREIVARTRLPAASLTSLRALVDAVERSLFARRQPDEQSFRDCMREYEALLGANRSAS